MERLTKAEIDSLQEALDDEYRAWATYDQVIHDFGEVPPFSNIRDAEARHIKALYSIFRRYHLAIPENPWLGKVESYRSVRDACVAGVAAEIANADLYERLLANTRHPDIREVFKNLQEASQQRHLHAFERCAQREGGGGGGGARQRRGWSSK
jgi:hypothetical protein